MTEMFDVPQGITGELRAKLAEYEPQETADEFIAHPIGEVGYAIMMALCDSIDAVHANLERENAELRDELRRIKKDGNDGLVELPKDADDEYIHLGDRMENGELVVRIVLTDGSWEPTVYTAATPNQLHEYYCRDIRHYHVKPDTWEDIIKEAYMRGVKAQRSAEAEAEVDALVVDIDIPDDYDLVACCKALAGDAE